MWMKHRMGCREGAEAEGRSSSGGAQCPGQFLFQTEGTRNSVKDCGELSGMSRSAFGKDSFPLLWRIDCRGAWLPGGEAA